MECIPIKCFGYVAIVVCVQWNTKINCRANDQKVSDLPCNPEAKCANVTQRKQPNKLSGGRSIEPRSGRIEELKESGVDMRVNVSLFLLLLLLLPGTPEQRSASRCFLQTFSLSVSLSPLAPCVSLPPTQRPVSCSPHQTLSTTARLQVLGGRLRDDWYVKMCPREVAGFLRLRRLDLLTLFECLNDDLNQLFRKPFFLILNVFFGLFLRFIRLPSCS